MASTAAFVGSVPETYHRYLGPLLFEPYAADIVRRIRSLKPARTLELACGSGIVTRHLAPALPGTLLATDLNDAMLDVARRHVGNAPRTTFRQADACELPFDDRSFDAIVCQYGVMFFPDKPRAMREARRVLAPGGRYIFNVWDSLEHNPLPRIVHETAARLFPTNPPKFLETPYGYFDRAEIERILRGAGFTDIATDVVTFPSAAPTSDDVARGFLEGTPLFGALQERGVTDMGPIRTAASETLAQRYGAAPCSATMRALVFTAA